MFVMTTRPFRTKNVDSNVIRMITQLYYNQSAVIKGGNEVSGEAKIRRGVRQGCVLSSMLFKLCILRRYNPDCSV